MRFSIVLAFIIVGALMVLAINSAFGEHSVIVFGLLGIWAVLAFFKHVVNVN
jgi:hypothetical protein